VPNDLEAVKLLAAAPAVLDLYMWLSYRCFKAKGPEVIPIFGEFGLANQLGCVEYSRPRRFRAMLDQWLLAIRGIWPECPASISADGASIRIRNGAAVCESQHQVPQELTTCGRNPDRDNSKSHMTERQVDKRLYVEPLEAAWKTSGKGEGCI
jgi:hypothetical protein